MKNILYASAIFSSVFSYGQYSHYYNVDVNSRVNANINANITHNVNGTIYENKTITTIDYGALQQANAMRERNALEQQKFNDERQKEIAVEIANDPKRAFDYGTWFSIDTKDKKNIAKDDIKKIKEISGLKNFRFDYLIPNSLAFNFLNAYRLQNVSKDGVVTDIYFFLPQYNKDKKIIDVEKDFENVDVGKEVEQSDDNNKMIKIFNHKKDLNRATVFGNKGYRSTYAWEDKFENHITDNYTFYNENFGDGVLYLVKIRYNGDKDDVDFEKLEGRRYYLKPLIEKIIATARISGLEN